MARGGKSHYWLPLLGDYLELEALVVKDNREWRAGHRQQTELLLSLSCSGGFDKPARDAALCDSLQ